MAFSKPRYTSTIAAQKELQGPSAADMARPKAKKTPTIAAQKDLDTMARASRPSIGGPSSSRGATVKVNSAPGRSDMGKNFDQSFAAAKRAGLDQFTWNGKKYTTKVK